MLRAATVTGLAIVSLLGGAWLLLRQPAIPFAELEARYELEASSYLSLPSGLTVHYTDEGPREAQVVVLVHGFAASLHTWDAWMPPLTDRYRVIRLDLPGHGLTRNASAADLTITGFGDAITAVTDQLDVERFAIAGSSMGGFAAWQYTLDQGERVEALILVDAAGWRDEGDAPTPLRSALSPFRSCAMC